MKQLLSFLVFIFLLSSCSIERRHYLPGFHVEWQVASGECRVANELHGVDFESEVKLSSEVVDDMVVANSNESNFPSTTYASAKETLSNAMVARRPISQSPLATGHSPLVTRHSPLATGHSPLPLDTLKKPFKPQQQYREVDPVGKASVIVVLAGVVLQKIVGMLTWFEVVMPWMFGPGIFIPALIVALIGVGLSAYSAYRARKYPEKYKKNEWGKASLAILGWQILMTVLFAWLLV